MLDAVVFSGFDEGADVADLHEAVLAFCEQFDPLERSSIFVLKDALTGAAFTECHVKAEAIIANGTTDVPLDPDDSAEYRANRDLVTSHAAFERMQEDAIGGRKFSNIVCEFSPNKPKALEVIGGQHRFDAISEAVANGVDVHHGLKVYFALNKEQRLDVQVISNTNIAVPTDLLDRMYATIEGTDLREWCQRCGLLDKGKDFADVGKRGNPMTVKEARTFIVNYFLGKAIPPEKFEEVETSPEVVESGKRDPKIWVQTKADNPALWSDTGLLEAGKQFAALIQAQVEFHRDPKSKKLKGKPDQIHKTKNIALLAAWAFVAGSLQANPTRLARHFELSKPKTKDPLRADLLIKARHHTDSENYRGLGFRTDAKERGRFAQLFWLQAEKGSGFTVGMIDSSIKGNEAKRANLAYLESKTKNLMSDFVEFSRSLMDAAKGFRTHALSLEEGDVKQAILRASFLHSCSFLEAHLNYMAEHFIENTMFSLHEKGVLLEKEVRFEHGVFYLSNTLKISRITDRIDLLLSKCSENPTAAKAGWFANVGNTLRIRNSLVHPKDAHTLTEEDVKVALTCMLDAADTLYNVVFKKGLPYAKKGIEGGLDILKK